MSGIAKRCKVSIITATYNSEKTLQDTLKSVCNQTYDNIEHIIIDGASTDSTTSIIREYIRRQGGKSIICRSEPDNGIYDALNKGISLATGDIVGFLHSDDLFANKDIISKIVERFYEEQVDGIYGDMIFVDPVNIKKVKRIWLTGTGKFEKGWTIPHQTLYLKKSIYDEYGEYITDMRNAADNEFILRVCKDGKIKTSYIKEVLVIMKLGGASTKNLGSSKVGFDEVQRSLEIHGIKNPRLVNLCRLFSKVKQILRAKVIKYNVEVD